MDRPTPEYEEKKIDWDRLFQTLQDSRRRQILIALMAETPRWKDGFETEEFRPAETERTAAKIDLHHCHLPYLDDAELIDWDRTTGLITRGEHFDEIRPILDLIDELADHSLSTGP